MEEINTKRDLKKWEIILQKSCGLVILLWGVFQFLMFISYIQQINKLLNRTPLFPKTSILEIAVSYHSILFISLFTSISGILVLLSQKTGWRLAITASAIHIFMIIRATVLFESHNPLNDKEMDTMILTAFLLTLIFGSIIAVILRNHLKNQKFQYKDLLFISILFSVFVTDYCIFIN